MRLAELMGALSLASDAAMGMPFEHGLRAAVVAVRVGELVGASDDECSDAMYLALLRYAGCTADSDVAADVFGDEVQVRGELYGVDWGAPREVLPRLARAVGRGRGPVRGAARVARTLTRMPALMQTATSHCEVGDRLADSSGFSPTFRAALGQTFERWDGSGMPRKLEGEAIALPMRLAQLGEDIEVGHRAGGAAAAAALAKRRARRGLDPRLVERFVAKANDVCRALDEPSMWTALLEAEPGQPRLADDDAIDEILRAMGHFADLKSRFTRTHASGVSLLARDAAVKLGLGAAAVRALGRAAWVHDLGRVAVSASVWDKAGPLSDPQWERVRMHTYVGERILSRVSGLPEVIDLATVAHERLDGKGYHRKLDGASSPPSVRLLAAADVYHAMTETRAHRPARGADEAAAELSTMARAGALCPDAVGAVLAAAGHAARPKAERPAGITDRELDVLRLVARGLTNKEVAVALGISTKTAGNHLQNIFQKVGVTTRAAATLFVMQKGLFA
jgi:HD-GYP domain-containing protein (c-di-GMP phosphodiesterase class II)